MESHKNTRGNSNKEQNTLSSQQDQSAKKKSQPNITQFFRKGGGSATGTTTTTSKVENSSANPDQHQQMQTRQSAKDEIAANTQTPKKKEAQTPKKKKVTQQAKQDEIPDNKQPQADVDEEELKQQAQIQSIKNLVDKRVKLTGTASYPASQAHDSQQPDQGRNLRPRKIENYKQMLDGDEVTIKTIADEQNEIKKKKDTVIATTTTTHAAYQEEVMEDNEDEEMIDEAQIERASDDEEDDDDYSDVIDTFRGKNSRQKRGRARIVDEDEDAQEFEDESSGDQEDDNPGDDDEANDQENESFVEGSPRKQNKRKQKAKAKNQAKSQKKRKTQSVEKTQAAAAEDEEETVFIDNLPNDEFEIRRMLKEVKKHIKALEKQFFEEEDSEIEEELKMINNNSKHDEALEAFKESTNMKQFWCIPLSVNVKEFRFEQLAESQMKQGGRLFDVITIDPPWQLSSANPTRGVAIAYETLNDRQILDLPFDKLQTDGFLFIWVINAKYRFALQMMEEFGYKLVDEIAWVKQTVNGKIAKGHGFYLQHAKETCLVGVKGNVKGKARFNIESDVIFSQRRGQSQKPEEIYEIAEALVPNGYYLEIFGRRNNLHNGWVTIGNEL